MHTTKDTLMTEWVFFTESFIRNFSPDRGTTGDLAPLHHADSMNDYINNFIVDALHAGITSEQHQVSLFIIAFRMHSNWRSHATTRAGGKQPMTSLVP